MSEEQSRRGDDSLQEICGLWERTSANGREYIGGRTPDDEDITIPAGSFVMVFPNESENPRAPAFRVLFSPPRDDGPRPAPSGESKFGRFKSGAKPADVGTARDARERSPVSHVATDEIQDDDIPF